MASRAAGAGPLLRSRAVGFAGALVLAGAAFRAGALPVTGGGPPGWPTGRGDPAPAAAVICAGAGLALLVVAWWSLGGLVRRRAVAPRALARTAVLWAAPLLLAPPLFSRDVYSYAVQGAMYRDGIDPYRFAADSYGSILSANVDDFWQGSTAPYGPLFLVLAAGVMRVAGSDIALGVLGLRLVMVSALVVTAWAVARLARRYRCDVGQALWLGVLNPLVLLHTVSGAHNDVLIVAMLLVAMLVAARGHPFRAAVVVGAAVLVKASAVVALAFLVPAAASAVGAWLAGRASTPAGRASGRHAVAAALVVATAGATSALITAATGGWYGWVSALADSTRVHNGLSLSTDLGDLLAVAFGSGPFAGPAAGATTVTRSVALLAAAVLVVAAVRRTTDRPVLGLGLAMVVVVVLGPVVHPWYLIWGFVPLAAVATSPRLRRGVAAGSVALVCYAVPTGNGLAPPLLALVAAGGAFGAACGWWVLADGAGWRSRGAGAAGTAGRCGLEVRG